MRSILEDDRLNAPSEVEETLKAILKWVSADAAARKGYPAKFLPLVRFVPCSFTHQRRWIVPPPSTETPRRTSPRLRRV
ncbi:hypothetical protein MTO96_044423 [Rhipicephalus appendiculatus]